MNSALDFKSSTIKLPENIMNNNFSHYVSYRPISLAYTYLQQQKCLKQWSLPYNAFSILCPHPSLQVHAMAKTLSSYVLCIGMAH